MISTSSSPHSPSSPSLAFLNLRYEVTSYLEYGWPKKALLRRLNGSFTSGGLNGLMGPSGSGKTTLLSVLSGKNTSGMCSNSSLYIGSNYTTNSFFVQQHVLETIEGALTVQQILEYAYQFKNGLGQRRQMVEHIAKITSKMLLNSANIFNNPFSNCSGGEQRRVAVAQELMTLTPPSFLFLDEPTTGLDSYAALELVKCLAELASTSSNEANKLTIIASIHAPSNELLFYFSKLYVLSKGVCIFSGPPKQIKPFFEGQNVRIKTGEQPIEALIRIACSDLSESAQLRAFAEHTLKSEHSAILSELAKLRPLPSGLPNTRKAFSLGDLYLNTCRQGRIYFIAKGHHLLLQLLFILSTTVAMSTFYNSPAMVLPSGCYIAARFTQTEISEDDSNLTSTVSTCREGGSMLRDFHLTENINYQSINREDNAAIILLISAVLNSQQAAVFNSEHRNRWYSLGVFYWATDVVSLLQMALYTSLISTTSYFVVSEQAIDDYAINWTRLGHFFACITLSTLHGQTLGQLIGVAFCGFKEIIMITVVFSYTMHLLLNDFFFKSAQISVYGYRVLADVLGLKHVTRYLVYVFYGVDRCAEGESSWVLERYDVPEYEQLKADLLRLLLFNIIGMKVATFVVMYLRFGSNLFFNWKSKPRNSSFVDENANEEGPIPIDFPALKGNSSLSTTLYLANNKNVFEQKSVTKRSHQTLIAWRNVTLLKTQPFFQISKYTLSKPKEGDPFSPPEAILHNLNGSFTFHSLNAIMGMSGAGKTTFLRLLNGQGHARLTLESHFYVSNQVPLSTVFITQEVDTHLMKGLTAKQSLVYASKLKNSYFSGKEKVNHEAIALGLLEELNIADTASTKVENLSGGEQKRLALALELTSVVMPNLICIDEPTSGLDSNSSEVIITTLQTLTRSHPISIVVSIHQPNSQLLSLFDSLYILATGGHAIYSGLPNGIERHLAQIQEAHFTNDESECSIETLIKHCSLRVETNPVVQQLETITRLKAITTREGEVNCLSNTFLLEDDSILSNRVRFSLTSVLILSSRYLAYMAGYQWKVWLPFIFFYFIYAINLTFFFEPSIASVSGCIPIYSDVNSTYSCSAEGEKQRYEEKLLFANVIYNFFFSNLLLMIVLLQLLLSLINELPLFENEHRNGYYSTGSWFVCKMAFEILPLLPVLAGYVYIIDIYDHQVVIEGGGLYVRILAIMLTVAATAQGFTYIVFLLVNSNITTTVVLVTAIMLLQFQLSNIFTSLAGAHYFYQLLSHLAFVRWPLQALMVLQYGFGRCGEKEVQPILYWMNLDDDDYKVAVFWMALNLILYRAMALRMLLYKVNSTGSEKRNIQAAEKVESKSENQVVWNTKV